MAKTRFLLKILAAFLAALTLLPGCQQTEQTATVSPEPTQVPVSIENVDIYWNLDRKKYPLGTENALTGRPKDADGKYTVALFLDGERVEVRVKDSKTIVAMDAMDFMGLEFDENGVVIGAVPIRKIPVIRVAWQFYVDSWSDSMLIANSSKTYHGVQAELKVAPNCVCYDMRNSMDYGAVTVPQSGDRIYAFANEQGEVIRVYIFNT